MTSKFLIVKKKDFSLDCIQHGLASVNWNIFPCDDDHIDVPTEKVENQATCKFLRAKLNECFELEERIMDIKFKVDRNAMPPRITVSLRGTVFQQLRDILTYGVNVEHDFTVQLSVKLWENCRPEQNLGLVIYDLFQNPDALNEFGTPEEGTPVYKNWGRVASASDDWRQCSRWDTVTISVLIDFLYPFMKSNVIQAKNINKKLLQDKIGSDLKIKTKEGKVVYCHKAFLIAASSVFEAMLQVKQFKEGAIGKIEMDDATEDEVNAFLHYIYCGNKRAALYDCHLAVRLFELGDKYYVKNLMEDMKELLLREVFTWYTTNDALRLYLYAGKIEGGAMLVQKALDILKMKPEDAIMDSGYYDEAQAQANGNFFALMRQSFV